MDIKNTQNKNPQGSEKKEDTHQDFMNEVQAHSEYSNILDSSDNLITEDRKVEEYPDYEDANDIPDELISDI